MPQFDICPTFLTKRELHVIFSESLLASQSGPTEVHTLSYPGFLEALARIALVALSKPVFEDLYPRMMDKLSVLLEMWGVGDPRRLEEALVSRATTAARK